MQVFNAGNHRVGMGSASRHRDSRLDVLALAGAVLLSHLAGVIGSFVTVSSVGTWYTSLAKPFFTPPSWVFAPVWLTLYTLMGIALWVVWRKRPRSNRPYALFGTQLGLNALWSILFFGLQSPVMGLAGIVVLWVLIALTLKAFWTVSRPAGWLLVPYLAWVTVATFLNLGIWLLNG